MNTTVLVIGRPHPLARRSILDWLFALLVLAGGAYAFQRYAPAMDVYEK
jgi:hypothetical protein